VTAGEQLSPAKQALLERALLAKRQAARPTVGIPRRSTSRPAPLSFAQQRMWFLEQWQPGSPTFNGARALRLRGPLDPDALEHSLRTVIERHESLRTVVVPGPEPHQALLNAERFGLERLPAPDPAPPGQPLDALLRDLSRRPFDLTRDLMLRATLVRIDQEEHVLLLCMHHIAADAHSDGLLFSELAELYDAQLGKRAAILPELPIQYADYAVWEQERLRGALLEKLRSYWSQALEGAPARLKLPTDRPRPPVARHDGAHHPVCLERRIAEDLTVLGREQGATFFIAMLAAFATFLYRLSGEQDIVIGSPIANRNNLELQGLIGFFTNTIPLRVRLDGNPTFRDVVARARGAALGAYAHQELPFEKIVEAAAPKRDPSFNPLFQVNFRAQAAERPLPALRGLKVEPIPVDIGFARFDLALEVEVSAKALRGYFEYNRDLFDHGSVVGFEEGLKTLLEQVTADPDTPVLALANVASTPPGRAIRRRRRA
jgi:Condensation domain